MLTYLSDPHAKTNPELHATYCDATRYVLTKEQHEWVFKTVMNENAYKLRQLVKLLVFENQMIKLMWQTYLPDINSDMSIAIESEDWNSLGQLTSKKQLIDLIKKHELDIGVTFIYGGWYGHLAAMMTEHGVEAERVISFDIDEKCEEVAKFLNKPALIDNWKFQASTADVTTMELNPCVIDVKKSNGEHVQISATPNTIINTSSEHMNDDWFDYVPAGTLLIMQSNNFYDCEGHVNCVDSIDEMRKKYPLSCEIAGDVHETIKYDRFTLIGYK